MILIFYNIHNCLISKSAYKNFYLIEMQLHLRVIYWCAKSNATWFTDYLLVCWVKYHLIYRLFFGVLSQMLLDLSYLLVCWLSNLVNVWEICILSKKIVSSKATVSCNLIIFLPLLDKFDLIFFPIQLKKRF